MSDLIEPFRLTIPDTQLDEHRQRLRHTRWPEPTTVDNTSQGPRLEKLRALVD